MLAAGDPCPSFKLDADHLLKADEVKLIQKDIDQLRSDGAEPQIYLLSTTRLFLKMGVILSKTQTAHPLSFVSFLSQVQRLDDTVGLSVAETIGI